MNRLLRLSVHAQPGLRAARVAVPVSEIAPGVLNEAAQRRPKIRMQSLADVIAEPVRWLWSGYIPFGKLTILEGDPGLGKSTLTLAVAAAVTTGSPLPGDSFLAAGHVLLLNYEDTSSDTVKPRFETAGGNSSRVKVDLELDGLPLVFPDHIEYLEEAVRNLGVRLVVIDPLAAAFNSKTDSYRDADVRRALLPFSKLAERTGAACVMVRHLKKAPGRNAVTAGGGSIGISGAARQVLAIHRNPENASQRVLSVVKCNVGATAASRVFSIVDTGSCGKIVWEGVCSFSADDLTARMEGDTDRSAIYEAIDLLTDALSSGGKTKRELLDAARAAGISPRTLERAKPLAGVRHRKIGYGGPVVWELANAPYSPEETVLANPASTGEHGENGDVGEYEAGTSN